MEIIFERFCHFDSPLTVFLPFYKGRDFHSHVGRDRLS